MINENFRRCTIVIEEPMTFKGRKATNNVYQHNWAKYTSRFPSYEIPCSPFNPPLFKNCPQPLCWPPLKNLQVSLQKVESQLCTPL